MLPGWGILKGVLIGYEHNGFNNLSRLDMMWNVRHRWPGRARFSFNCYRYSVHLLVHCPRELEMKVLMIREGLTHGYPLSVVIYGM